MSNRAGNRNAAAVAAITGPPPWDRWRTRKLHARAIRWIEEYCVTAKGHRHGEAMKLGRWQKEWLEEAFADNVDVGLLTLPRGNGKSTFAGAVATWALYDDKCAEYYGGRPDIPVIAPTLKQARKAVYGAAVDFYRQHPELTGRATRYTASGEERIHVHRSEGELYPAAADEDTLQGLDPSVALVDELGFVDLAAWDSLLLAAGKRPRNLILGLGTKNPEEVDNALDHLLAQLTEHGHVIDLGDGEEIRVAVAEYAGDIDGDPGDPKQWTKANPALADGFLRRSAIATAFRLSPLAAFRTYRLNLKTGSQAGWLGPTGPDLWDATEVDHVELGEVEPVYVGVDKSAYDDCSAVVCLQPLEGERWAVKARVWYPDPTIPHGQIRDHLRRLCAEHNVIAIGYDDRYFVEGAGELTEEGLPLVKVPQSIPRLVPAYSSLLRSIKGGHLIHEHDPTFRQHVLSAVPRMSDSNGFTLAKAKSKAKIDAAVAMGIARAVVDAELPEVRDYSDLGSFRVH